MYTFDTVDYANDNLSLSHTACPVLLSRVNADARNAVPFTGYHLRDVLVFRWPRLSGYSRARSRGSIETSHAVSMVYRNHRANID